MGKIWGLMAPLKQTSMTGSTPGIGAIGMAIGAMAMGMGMGAIAIGLGIMGMGIGMGMGPIMGAIGMYICMAMLLTWPRMRPSGYFVV